VSSFCEYMEPRPGAEPGDHWEFQQSIHEGAERRTVPVEGGGALRVTVCTLHARMFDKRAATRADVAARERGGEGN
jgi:hypothetical protein